MPHTTPRDRSAFRRGVTVAPFENGHIDNALAAALAVCPARYDSGPAVARRLLAGRAPVMAARAR
jgi:hypothetical protein